MLSSVACFGRVKLVEQRRVSMLPDAGRLQVTQPPPSRHARAAQLARNEPPRDRSTKTKTIALNAIRDARTTGRPRLDGRQQRLGDLPDLVAVSTSPSSSGR